MSTPFPSGLPSRPRRRRATGAIRALCRETRVTPDRLVLPLFLAEGTGRDEPIPSLPGHSRRSPELAARACEAAAELGIRSVVLFPSVDPSRKSPDGAEALRDDTLIVRAIRAIKRATPELCVMSDVALDPYNSDGHDGLVASGRVENDRTVEVLARMAVLHAQAGADAVAPSDMMDGRIGAIRSALDGAGLENTLILSYTAKYASALYGPFRDALDSAPVDRPGIPRDKKAYQMDPANGRESLVEAAADEAEGADILMVKPALAYLDVIARLRSATALPLAAYHVSGEYSMVHAAAERGWLDARAVLTEHLLSIARAGADLIFTSAAMDYARWWREDPLSLRA
jgi:porphobilinogen synthase